MNLVINSQFRPFTYDEMVKPLVQYKEAYDKVEQDYSDLIKQTEMWKDIANQTNSPEAYEMYNRYSNDLAAITDDFSRGMNLNNRRQLLNMKRRYYQDIDPIAKADAAMKEANDLRAKAGSDAIFEVSEYNSLDQFLHGKKANNRFISKDALTKKTAAITEAVMAEALKDPDFKKYMGDQFWLITQHTGGSYNDLMAAIGNNPQAQNRFAQIKKRVMAEVGVDSYDARGKAAIEEAINTGLYAGLDKPVRSFQANVDHMNPLQSQAYAQNAEKFKWAREDRDIAKEARQPLSLGDNKYLDPITNLTFTVDEDGKRTYDLTYFRDPNKTRSGSGSSGSRSSGSSRGTKRVDRAKEIVQITTSGKNAGSIKGIPKSLKDFSLKTYDDLDVNQKKYADKYRGSDSKDSYNWFVNKSGDLVPVPKTSVIVDNSVEGDLTGGTSVSMSWEETTDEITEGL